jgi:hypothetical protein
MVFPPNTPDRGVPVGAAQAIAYGFINFVFVPMVRASIELRRGHPERALEQLRIAAPYEQGFAAALGPTYLRGQSYLMQESGPQAVEEFQRILDHRGVDPFSPFYAVASLGLARARALCPDLAGSREAYEQFLAQWADADPDIPVLRQARSEYARVKRDLSPTGARSPRRLNGN